MRQLSEEEFWKLAFPGADLAKHQVSKQQVGCTGLNVFAKQPLATEPPRGGWPFEFRDGDILYGGGGNRLKVLWFRTHVTKDGRAAGPLAVVRTLEDHAELYALGVYEGSKDKTRLAVERMGTDWVVTAADDRCSGREPGTDCDSELHVLLPFRGELVRLATIGLERVRIAEGLDRGVSGPVEYRLTSVPTLEEGQIRLLEQVTATSADGRKLRKAEFERVLIREGSAMRSDATPLWDRMYRDRLESGSTKPESSKPAAGAKQASEPERSTPEGETSELPPTKLY